MKLTIEKALEYVHDCENSTPEVDWRTQSQEDYKFYAGDQDTPEVKSLLAAQNRPNSTYNEIKPKIDMLIGIAAQSRSDGTVLPVGQEDAPIAETLNGTLLHFRRKLRMKQKELDCFGHTVKAGRSLMYFWIDRSNPFKPVTITKRIPGFQFGIDPDSVELDLSDARYLYVDKWVTEDEYKELFPQADKTVITSVGDRYANVPAFFNEASNRYRLVELWYKSKENVVWFIDPMSGKENWLFPGAFIKYRTTLLNGIELEGGQTFQLKIAADLPGMGSKKDIYRYMILSGDIIHEEGVSPYKSERIGFPAVMYGAYRSDDTNVFFGAITLAKDIQRAFNTVRRQLVHLIQTLPKGILVHEAGSILNIEDYEIRSNQPNFHLEVSQGGINRYKFEKQPSISPIYSQLDMTFSSGMKDVTGIQDDLMGIQQSSRDPGIAVQLRQQSGLTVLYTLFDNYQDARIRGNIILLALIQQYVNYETVIRIEGQQGMEHLQINTEFNPQNEGFNDITAGEYDFVVDEVDESPTQRMMIARLLADMNHNNPGMIPPDIILEYSNAPFSVKQRVRLAYQQMMEAEEARKNAETGAKVLAATNKQEKQNVK